MFSCVCVMWSLTCLCDLFCVCRFGMFNVRMWCFCGCIMWSYGVCSMGSLKCVRFVVVVVSVCIKGSLNVHRWSFCVCIMGSLTYVCDLYCLCIRGSLPCVWDLVYLCIMGFLNECMGSFFCVWLHPKDCRPVAWPTCLCQSVCLRVSSLCFCPSLCSTACR